MATLFDKGDSDSETDLKVNKDYASNYNSWRQKEELNKLKTKYGEHIKNLESSGEESESSSDEDEDGAELTEEMEKSFYKTLACLKNKDPKIYDEKVKFFDESLKNSAASSSKKAQKEKKLFLRDYEREMVVERAGKLSDSEDEDTFRSKKRESKKQTYVEEQRALKESISKVVGDDSEGNDDDDLLVPKSKTDSEKLKEEETYKEWLKGQRGEIENEEKSELKPLRDFWTNPHLDSKEKFLRDYILDKKFLDNDNEDRENLDYDQIAHDSDENLSEDERNIEKQEEFEHKYNFRFEEPDQEFIKRYPRTLENSLRKKDTRRAEKRAEVKQRKEEEKIRKLEELKQLKALKRKEIAEKIAQLKEITGNDDIQFDNIDLDADFDPEEHDKKMREIFNEDYYAAPESDTKPEFPDIDEELGIERAWDDYDPETEEVAPEGSPDDVDPHCEDTDFNMDADYDPTKALQDELINSTKKKKRRRRSKFAELISKEKPKFDPELHSSFRDYIEQYYALDYEDMIDDLPCRFKYRKVVPNDYGLSVEEILMADDRELNKWCSLKKALEHKPEHVEMNEVKIYQQKSKNEAFKKKILKSLYTPEEEPQDPETAETLLNPENDDTANKKKRKKKKKKNLAKANGVASVEKSENYNSVPENSSSENKKKKKEESKTETQSPMRNGKKRKISNSEGSSRVNLQPKEPLEKKAKREMDNSSQNKRNKNEIPDKKFNNETNASNKKNKKHLGKSPKSNTFKKTIDKGMEQIANLSSERLKAYGLNPKKFKNKLKYGKKS